MKTMNHFLTIPITQGDRLFAQKFANQYHNLPIKQTKVLENILAVCAVKNYLEILGIATDISKNYSFNLAYQLTENVADLYLTEIGRLECRPVKSNQNICHIPAETWSNRIGYVAVELSANYSEAKLLGFIKKVTTENLPIEQLNSLDNLLETITEIELIKYEQKTSQRIKNWVNKSLELGWQTFDEVFGNSQLEYARNFRNFTKQNESVETMINLINTTSDEALRCHAIGVLGAIGIDNPKAINILSELIDNTEDDDTLWQAASSLAKIDPNNNKSAQRGVKVINLGMDLNSQEIILIIYLLPYDNQQIRVILEVKPKQENEVLPPNLKLALLSESNEVLNEIISSSKPISKVKSRLINNEEEGEDELMEMRFLLSLGNNYRVRITVNNLTIIEDIAI